MTKKFHSLQRMAPLALLLAFLVIPSPAKGCSASCEPSSTCSGGCSITPRWNCAGGCKNGVCDFQPYECYEWGSDCPEPPLIITGQCKTTGPDEPDCQDPPCFAGLTDPEPGASIWAVVDVEVEAGSLARSEVVAESQPDVGTEAFQRYIVEGDGSRWWARPDGRFRFVWARPSGRCIRVEGELLQRVAPFESALGNSYFFFDVRIDANATYLAIEPLYSDRRDLTRNAAQFLREHVRLSILEENPRSLQVFVGLMIDDAGSVGLFIAGAGELL